MVAASGMQALFHTALMRLVLSHYQKQLATLITIFMMANTQPSFILLWEVSLNCLSPLQV
jgi:hypothetical protein